MSENKLPPFCEPGWPPDPTKLPGVDRGFLPGWTKVREELTPEGIVTTWQSPARAAPDALELARLREENAKMRSSLASVLDYCRTRIGLAEVQRSVEIALGLREP